MKIIIQNHKFIQLISEDEKLLNKIRREFSFRKPGVEYTAAFQAGWDGVIHLINKKGITFLGLLSKIKTFLNDKKIDYTIEDKRVFSEKAEPIDLTNNLKKLNMTLRDYQEEIVDIATKNTNGIIKAATGSGKTLAAAAITAKLNKPTIIYVIGLDLLNQFHNLYSKVFDEEIGYIGDGVCDIKRINIATVWTIARALKVQKVFEDDEIQNFEKEMDESNVDKIKKMLEQTKVHILDECHIAGTESIKEIYNNINPEHIYGFSGTPFRDDGVDLLVNGILGDQIANISATELINRNVLAKPIIKYIPVPVKFDLNKTNYQTVYKEYIVENEERNSLIIEQTKSLIDKKYVPLILFKQIKHGAILFDLMKNAGINCEMLHGNDSLEYREHVKKLLSDRKIDAVLASTIFDIGVDIPIISGLVLAGSGKSVIRCLQRIGRCIRPYPGKKHAAIVDFYDQAKFLKNHAKARLKVYETEPAFKIIKCSQMN